MLPPILDTPTIFRSTAELHEMFSDRWSGRRVTAHLSKMGITTIIPINPLTKYGRSLIDH